jgi:hypothetical protein
MFLRLESGVFGSPRSTETRIGLGASWREFSCLFFPGRNLQIALLNWQRRRSFVLEVIIPV